MILSHDSYNINSFDTMLMKTNQYNKNYVRHF